MHNTPLKLIATGLAIALNGFALVSSAEVTTAPVQSVALLHVPARDIGSAFCLSTSGYFLTTENALHYANGAQVQVILWPNEPQEKVLPAQIVRTDKQRDLALLKISPPAGLAALDFANGAQVQVGQEITTFDYYLRNIYRDKPPFPSPMLRRAELTSGSMPGARADRLECDAMLTYGGSGAPVLNDSGKLIGMIESVGNRGASIMPLSRIRAFFAEPVVTLEPQEVPFARRYQQMEFKVRIVSLAEPTPNYEVEFSLGVEGEQAQLVSSPAIGSECSFTLAPCRTARGKWQTLAADQASGPVKGEVLDQPIHVGERTVRLNEIRRIDFPSDSEKSAVVLVNGAILKGKVVGLESLPVKTEKTTLPVDLSQSRSIVLGDADARHHALRYSLTVKSRGAAVSTVGGTIALSGDDPSGQPAPDSNSRRAIARSGTIPQPTDKSVNTPLAGGNGGRPMRIVSPTWADVVGFRYRLSQWNHVGIIQSFEPLYDRRANSAPDQMVGKDGYVVGGLLVDSDQYAHAVRVIFMRLTDGKLDVGDMYVSDWIGTPSSGQDPKRLAGDGQHVLGVCGRKGINMDAIGLVLRP